jgi:hypothetical protein
VYVREQSEKQPKELTFAVSGKLWNRSLIMIDSETKSLWSHLLGRAMEGELKGTELETVPSTMVDWKTWKVDHPETTVVALSRTSREFVRDFHDKPGRFVLGLRTLTEARAYSFDILRRRPVVNDKFDGEPVVLVYRPESAGGRAFVREVNGETLEFALSGTGALEDQKTGSRWNPETGTCEEGKWKGQQLREIPAIVSFEKAWKVFYPESDYFRE